MGKLEEKEGGAMLKYAAEERMGSRRSLALRLPARRMSGTDFLPVRIFWRAAAAPTAENGMNYDKR